MRLPVLRPGKIFKMEGVVLPDGQVIKEIEDRGCRPKNQPKKLSSTHTRVINKDLTKQSEKLA